MKNLILTLMFLVASISSSFAQKMTTDHANKVEIRHVANDFSINELDNANWKSAEQITIDRYWSGEKAPSGRVLKARLLWSGTALYVRFEANQKEPLVVSEKANLSSKTLKLWDRDVCEIFIAPDRLEPRRYFEFEIAPNGEWIDLGIDLTSGERKTDWDYKSGMQSAAKIEKNKIVMAIKIQWLALGKSPKPGDIWLGNLFRCVGKDPTRGYLAWQPTLTKEPAFHVPEKLGQFEFIK